MITIYWYSNLDKTKYPVEIPVELARRLRVEDQDMVSEKFVKEIVQPALAKQNGKK